MLSDLAIDHNVPATSVIGGQAAGRRVLERFVADALDRYGERNHPDVDVASGLSPYLHFGNVSTHEVFAAIADKEKWSPADLADSSSGADSSTAAATMSVRRWGMREL